MTKNNGRDNDLDLLSLGERLRDRRRELNLTLQHVANEAGLSVGFISQVERNISAPSLSSLAAIAALLELPLSGLLQTPVSGTEVTYSSERPAFSVPGLEISYERLSSTFAGSTLHSVVIHEPPGFRQEPISHEGEEMFYLLEGEITAEIDTARTVLRCGDSIHFDSKRTHSVWNHTSQTASILWCGTMNIFGDKKIAPIHKSKHNNTYSTKGDTP